MNRPLASLFALALIMALGPTARSSAQASKQNPPRPEHAADDSTLAHQKMMEALLAIQGHPANPPLNSPDHLWWRYPTFGRSSQGLNFTWVDAASRNSGMTLAPADPAFRAHLNLAMNEGLIVTALEPGSPAAAAGIRQNDVLLRIGDGPQRSDALGKPEDLEAGLRAAGDHPVSLRVLRGGKELWIKVQPRVRVSLGPVHPEPSTYWIGVSVTPIEPALRSQLQLPGKQGLIAMEVIKDGPAEKAGVRRYDILLKYDDFDLTDQDSLTKLVQSRGDRTAALLILRAGQRREFKITPERRKAAVTFRISEPQTAGFDIVLPGGVLSGLDADARQILSGAGNQPSAGKSTEQRLDEITAQIKELQKILETLSKAQEKK